MIADHALIIVSIVLIATANIVAWRALTQRDECARLNAKQVRTIQALNTQNLALRARLICGGEK